MMNREQVMAKWTGKNALSMLYGTDVQLPRFMSAILRLVTPTRSRVVDVGCGDGRLSMFFPKEYYLGLDINQVALDKAKEEHKGFDFRKVGWFDPLPTAGVYLFYTVLLHIPDGDLPNMVNRVRKGGEGYEESDTTHVVIVEVMKNEWRTVGPDFQRDYAAYKLVFQRYGFKPVLRVDFPESNDMTLAVFSRTEPCSRP